MIGLAYAISGFVVIHREKRKIERVRTDVDKRTAALLFLVDEHAPGGNGATTDSDSLGVVDFAEVILIGKFFEIQALFAVAVLIADGEDLAGFIARFDHLFGFFEVHRHGLFAHNVLARVERVDRDTAMLGVVSKYEYRVDALVFKKFFVVGVDLARLVAVLFVSLFRALGHNVAKSHEFAGGIRLMRGKMFAVCDTAAADNADSYFFHNFSP